MINCKGRCSCGRDLPDCRVRTNQTVQLSPTWLGDGAGAGAGAVEAHNARREPGTGRMDGVLFRGLPKGQVQQKSLKSSRQA